MTKNIWVNLAGISSKDYVCGHCNRIVTSAAGYYHYDKRKLIYLCPKYECNLPTFFFWDPDNAEELQLPAPLFGEDVKSLPDDIEELYNEARRCMAVSAYTSAVMLCRILLMHIAVEEGAKENLTFRKYVGWLEGKGYIPPGGDALVEYIRERGNDANHEIHLMKHRDAQNLITFIGMLMKFVYEYPSLVPQPESDS